MPLFSNDALNTHPYLIRMPRDDREWTRFIQALNEQTLDLGGEVSDIQDIVGAMFVDSETVNFTYNSTTKTITGVLQTSGIDHNDLSGLTAGDPHTQYVTPGRLATSFTDTSEIDFTTTVTGSPPSESISITAELIAGSVAYSKLDSGVQASLDLADTSIQPGDNVSELTNDAGYTTNTGTVTSVGTGTGLTGGPVTTTGSIALDSSSIASLALADTAVQPGDYDAITFITGDDETATFPGSLQLVAGDNVSFDTSTPGQLVIDATGGGGSLPADPDEDALLFWDDSDGAAEWVTEIDDSFLSDNVPLKDGNNVFTASGASRSTVAISIQSSAPYVRLIESDQSSSSTDWLLGATSATLHLGPVDDSATGPSANQGLHITRSGTTATEIQYDATLHDINGEVDISGKITLGSGIDALPTGISNPMIYRTTSGHTMAGGLNAAGSLAIVGRSDASGSNRGVLIFAGQQGVDQAAVATFGLSEIELNTTTVDLNGALDVSGNVVIGGTLNSIAITDFARLSQSNDFTGSNQRIVSSNNPAWQLTHSGAGTDEGRWAVGRATTTQLQLGRTLTDDNTGVANAIVLTRSGTTITSMALAATAITLNGVDVTNYARKDAANTFTGTAQVFGGGNSRSNAVRLQRAADGSSAPQLIAFWSEANGNFVQSESTTSASKHLILRATTDDAGSSGSQEPAVKIRGRANSDLAVFSDTSITLNGVNVTDYARLSQNNAYTGTQSFATSGDANHLTISVNSTVNSFYGSGTTAARLGTSSNHPYTFYTNNTARFEIGASGNYDFKDGTVTTSKASASEVGTLGVPLVTKTADYTVVKADAGTCLVCTSAADDITIQESGGLSQGMGVLIDNQTGGTIDIIQGSGSTLVLAGTSTTGSRTLAAGGTAYVFKVSGSGYRVGGPGVA